MGFFSLERRRARDRTWIRGRKLGEGGVACTYLGVRPLARGDQRAALKDIHADKWVDPEFREQFWAEMEAVASLRHGKIVSIIDTQPKLGRLVLELVDGVDLQRLVSALPERRLPWDLVALIARDLCYALGYAHRRRRRGEEAGVVHRDLKASNVLISYEGEVKLTDFGLAKIRTRTSPHSNVIRGTVGFLSPEQTRPEQVLDGRSDLFSLGVLLYELLTGHRPFDGPSDDDVIYATREGKRRPLRDYDLEGPPELFAIVEKLLAIKREDRFQTAEAVLDQLELLQTPHRVRELGRLARMALPPVTVGIELDHPRARALSTIEPARRVWLAAALSVAAVASLGTARMFSQTTAAADAAPVTASRNVSPTTIALTATSAAPRAELLPASPAPPFALGSEAVASPDPGPGQHEPAPPPSSLPTGVAEPPAATPEKPRPGSSAKHAAEEVRVLVGSVPLPNVNIWIDGEPRGRGPIDTTLKPGKHRFEAGREKPEYKVIETVKAGTKLHKVIIQRDE